MLIIPYVTWLAVGAGVGVGVGIGAVGTGEYHGPHLCPLDQYSWHC